MKRNLLLLAALLSAAAPTFGSSYYTSRPNDAKAVYLDTGGFSAQGNGVTDDTDALQRAINKVQETTNQGIVFIPSGRYRVTRTIYVWPGIRLIGFGATRPVFVLAAHAPGFQQGPAYMIFFAGFRPGSLQASHGTSRVFPPANAPPPDANPGTFYSAISNLDIEIPEGNPGAVGIRARYAQHCFLAHMEFRIGSAPAACP